MAPGRPEILVIDDESYVRQMLATLLSLHGLDVHLASSGQAALDIYSRHRDTIRGVLIDVQMPDWDGPRTLQALHDLNPDLPCCFMTGNFGEYSPQDLARMGVAEVFSKPFLNIRDFVQSLKRTFGIS